MNPESRCGRSPTVVLITRSQVAFTGARCNGGLRGVAATDFDRDAHALAAKPTPAAALVVRNALRCMSADDKRSLNRDRERDGPTKIRKHEGKRRRIATISDGLRATVSHWLVVCF